MTDEDKKTEETSEKPAEEIKTEEASYYLYSTI